MRVDDRDAEAIRAAKDAVRADVLARRRRTGPRPADDAARTGLLLERLAHQSPEVVACYCSVGAEPGTADLIDAVSGAGWAVLLPVLDDLRSPDWSWHTGEFRPGPRGIPQPATAALGANRLADADVIIVPGLAGGPDGTRLGTGGGWYDVALSHARVDAPVWLLLRDEEVQDDLPSDPWDRRVSDIITPTRWIHCLAG